MCPLPQILTYLNPGDCFPFATARGLFKSRKEPINIIFAVIEANRLEKAQLIKSNKIVLSKSTGEKHLVGHFDVDMVHR